MENKSGIMPLSEGLHYLTSMFPDFSSEIILGVLAKNMNRLEETIEDLLNLYDTRNLNYQNKVGKTIVNLEYIDNLEKKNSLIEQNLIKNTDNSDSESSNGSKKINVFDSSSSDKENKEEIDNDLDHYKFSNKTLNSSNSIKPVLRNDKFNKNYGFYDKNKINILKINDIITKTKDKNSLDKFLKKKEIENELGSIYDTNYTNGDLDFQNSKNKIKNYSDFTQFSDVEEIINKNIKSKSKNTYKEKLKSKLIIN